MVSSDAMLMNICTIIFQGGEERGTSGRVYPWRFSKIVANMRCRARSTHGIRQVYHHRNAILSISSFSKGREMRVRYFWQLTCTITPIIHHRRAMIRL